MKLRRAEISLFSFVAAHFVGRFLGKTEETHLGWDFCLMYAALAVSKPRRDLPHFEALFPSSLHVSFFAPPCVLAALFISRAEEPLPVEIRR